MKKVIKLFPTLFVSAVMVLSAGVCTAQASKAKSGHGKMNMSMTAITDTGFVRKNIMDNMMEVRLSEIGRDNTASDQVRALAEQMLTDHTNILNDLTTIGGKLGVPAVDTTTLGLPTADNTPAENFDVTWLNQMLTMHKAKVQELQMAIGRLKDPTLKAAATSALPKIKLHTDMLAKLAATAGKK